MWNKIKPYVYSIALALGVGALASFLTQNSMAAYESVPKSALTPPSVAFPIVWSVLFLLMGISAAMVWKTDSPMKKQALTVYGIQLAVNFFWSILFFNLQAYLFAFLWLILLWCLILAMIVLFYRINKAAGLLQIPYLLWVSFAGYLNCVIWIMNR